VNPSPEGLSSQEQEALSKRYGKNVAIVIPLRDGSFAVFSEDLTSESLIVVDDNDNLAMAINSRANMHGRKTPSKNRDVGLNIKSLLE
jgi:hypothetical protein